MTGKILRRVYNDLKQMSRGDYLETKKYLKKSLFLVRCNQKRKMKGRERIKLANQVTLTKQQINEIRELFKSYLGKKTSLLWHKYYQSLSGSYDKRYIPEIIYAEMELLFNDSNIANAFSNKVIQHKYFVNTPGVYIPKFFAQVHEKRWYTLDMHEISIKEVAEIFQQAGRVFAKPISDSSSGIGCEIIKIIGGKESKTGLDISEFLNKYSDNYMFEEVIECSEDISRLHPNSVNTFRIMSYRLEGEIFLCPTIMRIGRNNNEVDNAHAGGVVVALSDDGVIVSKNAVTEFNERFLKHPNTNIVFENYRINGLGKVVSAVKSLHASIPGVGFASWDMTINKEGIPTFIEVNLISQSPWLPQMAHGKGMFSDNTEKMLEKLKEKRQSCL